MCGHQAMLAAEISVIISLQFLQRLAMGRPAAAIRTSVNTVSHLTRNPVFGAIRHHAPRAEAISSPLSPSVPGIDTASPFL